MRYQQVWIETVSGELLDGWVTQALAERVIEGNIPIQAGEEIQLVVDSRYKNLQRPLMTQNLWLKIA